jgi:hypothetical protein
MEGSNRSSQFNRYLILQPVESFKEPVLSPTEGFNYCVLERHLRQQGCLLYREGGDTSYGCNQRCARPPVSDVIERSKREQFAR